MAVEGVDLTVHDGEVHVVAGENGAGKSTLMRLIAQSIHADSGTIEIRGEPVQIPRREPLGVAASRWSIRSSRSRHT